MDGIKGQFLNVWALCREGTRALGPGLRYVVWTQGCLKRCRGCTSPESQPIEVRQLIDVEALASDIVNRRCLSGITISGGEPFLQAAPLTQLIKSVRQARPQMSVIVFTGYEREELKWTDATALLSETDVLIDGPFRQEMATSRGLRGSLNQRIHFMTDMLIAEKDEIENGHRRLDIFVENDKIVTIGIPTEETYNTQYKNF